MWLLGKLMEDKLYAHHAEQDSLEIDNQQIFNYVDKLSIILLVSSEILIKF